MSNITFICEGQSEKNLVEHILAPYWESKGCSISCSVIILGAGNPCNKGTGGDVTFERLKVDLSSAFGADNIDSYFTTIFDFYELHGPWPGKNFAGEISALEKVVRVENESKENLKMLYLSLPIENKFIPYFMLHEYDSLLFTNPADITNITKARSATEALQNILHEFNSKPEEINTTLSPSQRLVRAKANYSKTLHAHRIMQSIGVDEVRMACPHFNDLMTKLETLA